MPKAWSSLEVWISLAAAGAALLALTWSWAALAWDVRRRLGPLVAAIGEHGLSAASPSGRGPFTTASRAAMDRARALAAAAALPRAALLGHVAEAFDLATTSHPLATAERATRILVPLGLVVEAGRVGLSGDFVTTLAVSAGAYGAWAILRYVPTFERRVVGARDALLRAVDGALPTLPYPEAVDEEREPSSAD